MDTSLNAARRAHDIVELAAAHPVDVLVVGLGVTGAGVALDAASRGLTVAAIDAEDLAFGTSRWSSKLVHGGLRYLARLDVAVARQSAVERGILVTHTAPHLIRALPMVLPFSAALSRVDIGLARAAGRAGDLLRAAAGTSRDVLPKPRHLSTVEAQTLVPGLNRAGLRGGELLWDGQLCDDARLVVGLARAAAGHGARIVTRCRALDTQGNVVDELTGHRFRIRARAVINATGVWASTLASGLELRPSRGTHLILPGTVLGGLRVGLTIPVPGERSRFVFALPQLDGRVYVGLTDDPLDGPIPRVPEPDEADVRFLLGVLNSVLREPVGREQVIGCFAGLRPLLAHGQARSADMSRKHAIRTDADGVVTVVGGKLTTYRRMAEEAVDAAVRRHHLPARACRTRRLALPGAAPPAELARVPAPERLVARYGTEAPLVAALGTQVVAPGVTMGELRWGVRHEGALDVDDLLDRRTRAGLVRTDRERALPAALAAQEQESRAAGQT
jgi:glycerol-3-phosphate dehydrogenase